MIKIQYVTVCQTVRQLQKEIKDKNKLMLWRFGKNEMMYSLSLVVICRKVRLETGRSSVMLRHTATAHPVELRHGHGSPCRTQKP